MGKKERSELVRENLQVAERAILEKLARPDAFPAGAIVIPLRLLVGKKNALTPSRWAIIQKLRERGGYERLNDLAEALGRSKYRVSKDVDVLTGLGLVHKVRHGKRVAIRPDPRTIVVA